jgi:hypothetical protein
VLRSPAGINPHTNAAHAFQTCADSSISSKKLNEIEVTFNVPDLLDQPPECDFRHGGRGRGDFRHVGRGRGAGGRSRAARGGVVGADGRRGR